MEAAVLIPLVLLIISEVLPYTKFKGNGIIQEVISILKKAYPVKRTLK